MLPCDLDPSGGIRARNVGSILIPSPLGFLAQVRKYPGSARLIYLSLSVWSEDKTKTWKLKPTDPKEILYNDRKITELNRQA